MVDLIYGRDAEVAEWVRVRTDVLTFGACAAIGVALDGTLIAGLVYREYTGRDIQLSIAADSPKWCTKRTLRYLLGYPFLQLKCARVTAIVAKKNKRSRTLVERLGFKLEGTIRRAFPKDHGLIYGMLREECKWC